MHQDTSVAKAKQAISNYRKAIGEPAGLAELMVFYCERATGFCSDLGYQDESYFNALIRMFEQAIMLTDQLPASQRTPSSPDWTARAQSATISAGASAMTWTHCSPNTGGSDHPVILTAMLWR